MSSLSLSGDKERIAVFGATGSIGSSTLDILARHPERFVLEVVSAHSQDEKLLEICKQFNPSFAVLGDEDKREPFKQALFAAGLDTQLLLGDKALEEAASLETVDCVVAAIVGAAGLPSSLAAAKAGKKILLANKESLVMAGSLFMQAVKKSGATLLPIDSEHNAIFQCLPSSADLQINKQQVRKVLLTASGGPFRTFSLEEMKTVTPEQACAHPNWSMGRKISVDSASMMNKGLELIEACWLFDITPDDIDVVVHPQSIIHSMVQYIDGSTLAQMGSPDMRTPIANALSWPERIDAGVADLDLFSVAELNFEPADTDQFPNLALAAKAFKLGGAMPCVLNAANEISVDRFLNGEIGFMDIAKVNELTIQAFESEFSEQSGLKPLTVEELVQLDLRARGVAAEQICAIEPLSI